MRIDENTKYAPFALIENTISEDDKKRIMDAAEQKFGSCHMLSIDEFFGCIKGDFSHLGDLNDPTVFQAYWIKRFKDFCKEFSSVCERLAIHDPDMDGTDAGCVKIEPAESMLIFVREYFGLHSFADAGKVTIGEYVLARKDKYNSWKVRKNYERKQISKIKSKKR